MEKLNLHKKAQQFTDANKIIIDTIFKDKQIIVFENSKRNAENYAKKISELISKLKPNLDWQKLEELSNKIKNILDEPTEQCIKLSNTIKNGFAFHHSGLLKQQRELIEEAFRKGILKGICATPTLAMGVDMPAFRVIIKNLRRWNGNSMGFIPNFEYHQMAGRAGRPRYDKQGEVFLFAKSEKEADFYIDNYILGETEEILSKLGNRSKLRIFILVLLSQNKDVYEFINNTFFAYQFGQDIKQIIDEILEELIEWDFIDQNLKPKYITHRIVELYLDPLTAYNFINYKIKDYKDVLYLIADSTEMIPLPNLLKKDELINNYSEDDRVNKLMDILEAWINEKSEKYIFDRYSITPGELHSRIEISNWLLYCFSELSRILKKDRTIINKLHKRIKYGVKEELLSLVELKGLGRKKARKLFNSNIKNKGDIRKISLKELSLILGKKTAENIKEQV